MTEEIISKIAEALRDNPALLGRAEIAYRFLLDPHARVVSQGALDFALGVAWQDEANESDFLANIKSWMPRDTDAEREAKKLGHEDSVRCSRWERIVIHRKPNNYQRVMIDTKRNIAYLVPRIRRCIGGPGHKAVGVPQSEYGLFEANVSPIDVLLVHKDEIARIGVEGMANWPDAKRLVGDADVLLGQWESSEQVWDLKRYLDYVRTHARHDQPWNL